MLQDANAVATIAVKDLRVAAKFYEDTLGLTRADAEGPPWSNSDDHHVAPSARRDLKPAAWLHLDPGARFPRLTVRPMAGDPAGLFGPFRNRPAAARAVAALHKLFPLRPCDFVFEPAPDLSLGLGCVYAQVRTCAAPCLSRVSEDGYRGLAGRPPCSWATVPRAGVRRGRGFRMGGRGGLPASAGRGEGTGMGSRSIRSVAGTGSGAARHDRARGRHRRRAGQIELDRHQRDRS